VAVNYWLVEFTQIENLQPPISNYAIDLRFRMLKCGKVFAIEKTAW
jgi:hypothetical protein